MLHHLSGSEVDRVLQDLTRRLKPGARIWVYEPAFAESEDTMVAVNPLRHRLKLDGVRRIMQSLYRQGMHFDLLDRELHGAVRALQDEADARGWYLSPKEVPFAEAELAAQLGQYTRIVRHYWATVLLVKWAYHINLIRNDLLRRILAETLLRILSHVDAQLASDEEFVRRELRPPAHGFHVWECITVARVSDPVPA